MMVKSGLEKLILKFLHAGTYFPLLYKISKITNSVTTRGLVLLDAVGSWQMILPMPNLERAY